MQGYFSDHAIIGKILSREDSSTYRLGQSTVVFGAWFILLKAPNLLFHLIKLSRMFTVSFIKLVPCSKRFIKASGNFCILLSQCFSIINSLIQSLRLQEGLIGNFLQGTTNDGSDIINYSKLATVAEEDLPCYI